MRISILIFCLFLQTAFSFSQQKEMYLKSRKEAISKDVQLRFDQDLVLNEDEKKAGLKLQHMQDELLVKYKTEKFFPPSRSFYQSKNTIENTDLFKVLEKMPKGGALHLHTEGTTSIGWVVTTAVNQPDCYVYWASDNQKYIKGQIGFFNTAEVPAGFRKASELNLTEKDFKRSLTELLTFNEKTTQDSALVWKEFERCFNRIRNFVTYKPVFEAYYLEGFKELIRDNIQYAEIRAIVSPSLYDLKHNKQSNYYSTDSILGYFKNVRLQLKKTDPDFRFRLVYTFIRGMDAVKVDAEYINAFKMQLKYPDLISGFDLVGEEDRGHSTLFFLDTWMKRDSLEKAYGIKMPFLFHDGESNIISDENMYDAVLLKCQRIGHGFNLFLFPGLYEQIRKENIAIEICPLSSQLLNFTRDLRSHPGIGYLRNGIQCVISSDDPSIFGFSGLTYDFWSAFMAWELDLKSLKKLSMNSIQYSTLPAAEKELAIVQWQKRWDSFIASVNAVK